MKVPPIFKKILKKKNCKHSPRIGQLPFLWTRTRVPVKTSCEYCDDKGEWMYINSSDNYELFWPGDIIPLEAFFPEKPTSGFYSGSMSSHISILKELYANDDEIIE